MAASNTIATRISLEGAEEVKAKLNDLSKAGEDALGKLKNAAPGANFDGLQKSIDKVNVSGKQLVTTTSTLDGVFKSIGPSVQGLGTALEGLVARFTGLSSLTLAGVAAGFVAIAESSVAAAVGMNKSASLAGVTFEQYQNLARAARASGLEQEGLDKALRKFTQNVDTQGQEQFKNFIDLVKDLSQTLSGGTSIKFINVADFQKIKEIALQIAPALKEAFQAANDPRGAQSVGLLASQLADAAQKSEKLRTQLFSMGLHTPAQNTLEALDRIAAKAKGDLAALGITLIATGDSTKAPGDAFREFIDKVSAIPDKARAAQVIIKQFGRTAGPELADFILKGTASLDEIAKKAKELGVGFSGADLAAAKEAKKAIRELTESFTDLKNQLGIALAPSLGATFDGWAKAVNLLRSGIQSLGLSKDTIDVLTGSLKSAAIAGLLFAGPLGWIGAVILAVPLVAAAVGDMVAALEKFKDKARARAPAAKEIAELGIGQQGEGALFRQEDSGPLIARRQKILDDADRQQANSAQNRTESEKTAAERMAKLQGDAAAATETAWQKTGVNVAATIKSLEASVKSSSSEIKGLVSASDTIFTKKEKTDKKETPTEQVVSAATEADTKVRAILSGLVTFTGEQLAAMVAKIVEAFAGLPDKIQQALTGLPDIIANQFKTAANRINLILDPIAARVNEILSKISQINVPSSGNNFGGVIGSPVAGGEAAASPPPGSSKAEPVSAQLLAAITEADQKIRALLTALNSFVTEQFASLAQAVSEGLSAAFKTLSDAIEGVASSVDGVVSRIVASVQRALDSLQQLKSAQTNNSGDGGGGGDGIGRARGGPVFGPGTSTSDSIFARLSHGEFVMRAAAVQKYGTGLMYAINNLRLPKFSTGGLFDTIAGAFARMQATPRFAQGGFVPRAGTVQTYGSSLLEALGKLRLPTFSAGGLADQIQLSFADMMAVPRFAQGGLALPAMAAASSGATRTSTFVLDGKKFGPFSAPADVVGALERHSIFAQAAQTGKYKPRWVR